MLTRRWARIPSAAAFLRPSMPSFSFRCSCWFIIASPVWRRTSRWSSTSSFCWASCAPFGTTLTLPGIAGVVLTIGMAVDANVLIYERLREELAKGKSLRGAIAAGYARAFGTIFDSHVTTLISSVILILHGHRRDQGLRRDADHRHRGQLVHVAGRDAADLQFPARPEYFDLACT